MKTTFNILYTFLLSETLPLFRKSQLRVLHSSVTNRTTRKESNHGSSVWSVSGLSLYTKITHLQVLSMSAPYESAKPISLSQMRSVQVSMLGRGYRTIVCKKRKIKNITLLVSNESFCKFQCSTKNEKSPDLLYYIKKNGSKVNIFLLCLVQRPGPMESRLFQ
jgi:hypothetical protein